MDTGIAPRTFTRPLIVARATLLVVALFQSIRSRAEDAVDAAQRTVQPAHASVWLLGRP